MTASNKIENKKISATRLLLFVIIAFVVSNLFRFDIFHIRKILENSSNWSFIITNGILEGSGILIAGLLGIFLLRKQRKTELSFFGTSVIKSIGMALIPTVLLIVIGVQNKYGIDAHYYGFLAAIGTFIYCIMEEYGWRGYLQEEFKFLKPVLKFMLVGVIWYAWHLSFLTATTFADNLFFLGALIFGSWGIGKTAELTKSILACACIHLIVNIFMYNYFFNNAFSGASKLIILSVSVSLWALILIKWNKPLKIEN